MIMSTFTLEIVTPQKVSFSDNAVSYINVPGESGVLGILPHHTALFAKLTEGEVKIVKGNEETYLAIGGGFIEVNKNKVTILVTRAVHATEINERSVMEAQRRAEELLKQKPTGEAFAQAQEMYRRSLLDLKVLRRRYKTSRS